MSEDFNGIQRQVPDLILISLSLPDDGAFKLFRLLRTNLKTKYTPIFALVVKTDSVAQQQAQQLGFSAIITKPIEIADLESKMAKAMNLDTSPRYFNIDKEFFTMRLPENCSPIVINEVNNHLKTKLAEAVNAGLSRAIIDVQEVKSLNMTIISECKGFEDTRSWSFFESMVDARAFLSNKNAANRMDGDIRSMSAEPVGIGA